MKISIIDTPKEINISDQKVTEQELFDTLDRASTHTDTIIKLYREKEEDYIVTFSWQEHNKWKIDYPIELQRIHKQRYVSHRQCLQLSKHIFKGNSLDELKGFIDVPIRHFTLDDMLEFKKEDEMMLNGQNPDQYAKKQPKELSKPKQVPTSQQTSVSPTPTSETPIKKTTSSTSPKPLTKTATKPSTTTPKTPKPSTPDEDSFFSL